MGTRADFYIGNNEQEPMRWLGSIGWDGDDIPDSIRKATKCKEYEKAVMEFLKGRDDATLPEEGWPWPWDNSKTTDCSYSFFFAQTFQSSYGGAWIRATEKFPSDAEYEKMKTNLPKFLDMKSKKKVQYGKKSGLITIPLGSK